MRRSPLALILGLALLAAAPAAEAQTTVKEHFVSVFYSYNVTFTKDGTRYDRLEIYDVEPGSKVVVSCRDTPDACPFTAGERVIGASRRVNVAPIIDRVAIPQVEGKDGIQLAVTTPDGRRVDLVMRTWKGRLQMFSGGCRLPDGTESPCVVDCPVGTAPPATQPCASVTRVPRKFPKNVGVNWRVSVSPKGITRFTRFVVHDVPGGTSIYAICEDPRTGRIPCREMVAFWPPSPAGRTADFDLTSIVRNRRMPPGSTLTLQMRKPGYVIQQLRYTMRKTRLPRIERFCLEPGKAPKRC